MGAGLIATRIGALLQVTPRPSNQTYALPGQLAAAVNSKPGRLNGPASGVFLQITCDDAVDLPVPGQRYTFGVVKAAQARDDFQVLAERNRRALRVHLGTDVRAGLVTLEAAVQEALA